MIDLKELNELSQEYADYLEEKENWFLHMKELQGLKSFIDWLEEKQLKNHKKVNGV